MSNLRADAVLFDKDGTLFDFSATWDVWAHGVLTHLAAGQDMRLQALATAVAYDLDQRRFHPHSIAIAGTTREVAQLLAATLPDWTEAGIESHLVQSAACAPLVEAVALAPFLDGLARVGLRLGVMTNDTEFGARSHLRTAGVEEKFHFIAGCDSGHGAKPSPEPLLAFARAQGLDPERVVMVGDSTHDLQAGRAAGMQCVGVLTGPATRGDLDPLADAVLPDIGHLPDWLRIVPL